MTMAATAIALSVMREVSSTLRGAEVRSMVSLSPDSVRQVPSLQCRSDGFHLRDWRVNCQIAAVRETQPLSRDVADRLRDGRLACGEKIRRGWRDETCREVSSQAGGETHA